MKDWHDHGYTFTCKRWRFREPEVRALLKLAYWANQRDAQTNRRALRHAFPFGVFDPAGHLVGFLRITTDQATVYYVADVVVAQEERGKGLGLKLVQYALSHPRACRGKGMLLTQTAHGLYEKVGFAREGERLMIRPADAAPVKPGA